MKVGKMTSGEIQVSMSLSQIAERYGTTRPTTGDSFIKFVPLVKGTKLSSINIRVAYGFTYR